MEWSAPAYCSIQPAFFYIANAFCNNSETGVVGTSLGKVSTRQAGWVPAKEVETEPRKQKCGGLGNIRLIDPSSSVLPADLECLT